MINNVTLMGRICQDLEPKTTNSGITVCTFTVAVDRYSKGEEKQADFINIVTWRKTAEFVCQKFKKGQMIALTGSIQTRNYEDKNGNKRTAFEVVANNVSFCGDKKGDSTPATDDKPNIDVTAYDDELPF